MSSSSATITIKNNTNAVIGVSLGHPAVMGDSIFNARNTYAWNVCSQLFEQLTTVTVIAAFEGGAGVQYSAPVLVQSLQGVVTALNTLRIGTFYSTVISGETNIAVTNDSYVYTDLNINDSSGSTTINFNWNFTLNTAVPVYSLQVLNSSQGFLPILLEPNQPTGSVQNAVGVNKGDTIDFFFVPISAGPYSGTVSIYKNGCLLESTPFSGAGSGIGAGLSITYDRDPDVYNFVVTVN